LITAIEKYSEFSLSGNKSRYTVKFLGYVRETPVCKYCQKCRVGARVKEMTH